MSSERLAGACGTAARRDRRQIRVVGKATLRALLPAHVYDSLTRDHRRLTISRPASRIAIARRARRLRAAPEPKGVQRLDQITVINLARRTDRLTNFDAEMKRLDIPSYTRFDAIEHDVGIIGCTLSHAACVRQIVERSLNCAMICEDDARFLASRTELDVLVDEFLNDEVAEVACLGYKNLKPPRGHSRLFLRAPQPTVTASCYLVKHSIALELAECVEGGARELQLGGDRAVFGNDEIWTRLQGTHVFVIPIKRAVRQADGYSDVEERVLSGRGV